MPIFPTQYSILSAKALNEYLQEQYGIIGSTCKLLIRNVSDTYILDNGASKYIFKIYRDSHRKVEEIKGEIELLSLLHNGGAKISYPLADLQGRFLQRSDAAEGTRYGVLFTWANGAVITSFNNKQLNIVGAEMAAIHNISSTISLNHYRKPYTAQTTIIDPLKTIEPAFQDLQDEYDYLVNTGTDVATRLNDYQKADFNRGYCHFDFLPKNFHFTKDDTITFFDFDFAGEGLLAYDITSFLIHFFLEVNYGKMSLEDAQQAAPIFIESYRKVRPFTDEEIHSIPDLGFAFWVFYLGFQYENYDDWSNLFFSPRFIKERVALIKKWMETATLLLP